MVAMVVMAMVIAMEVMVIDKFQNICQQDGDGFDDCVDMLLSLANSERERDCGGGDVQIKFEYLL